MVLRSFLILMLLAATLPGTELHVAINGSDANAGTKKSPFRTIQRAAEIAQPGDVVTVHQGAYRERVNPARGGASDKKRIVYQAAARESVTIKGSEAVTNWVKVQDDTWKVTIPNSFFGGFNPYGDAIHGDWFNAKGRQHHTGCVYLDDEWLVEAAKLDEVLKPAGKVALWFGQVDVESKTTTLWAQFKGVNPNEHLVEINKRQTVFYPEKTGINYITVRGFTMEQAATPWAPPTAEQMGLIGTHWSKGWIIESNVVRFSRCSGIALGKYGDEWDNKSESAEGYIRTIHCALTNGWNRDAIGHHIVRNNRISYCEQTGIVGSLGCCFSTITGNEIHDIHMQRLFTGAEMAGIKFHGAIDVVISGNNIHRTCLGIWLDWMAQGAQITSNLLHENDLDLFCEVDHGPFLVANNIFLSPASFWVVSQGGAYAHNLIAGTVRVHAFDARQTPFHKAHSTELAGLHDNPNGDVRYYNNLFVANANLSCYDKPTLPVWMAGNVFLKGTTPCVQETLQLSKPDFNAAPKLVVKNDGVYLDITLDKSWAAEQKREKVTTELLGNAIIPNLPYENADGSPLRINTDYFGKKRKGNNPFPGPFEISKDGRLRLKVWSAGPTSFQR